MAKQKNRFLRALQHLFRRRNIIIVSDKTIDHYPVSGKAQLAIMALVIGAFSWVSYSTGGYMAAQSIMKQKDQQIVSTTLQNKRMGEEYSLLKQDLIKLQDAESGELSDYAKFIIDQHSDNEDVDMAQTFAMAALDATDSDERLQERVDFLEERIEQLKDANQSLVLEVHRRTKGRIAALEEALRMTGLDNSRLQAVAEKEIAMRRNETIKPAKGAPEGQGGPFIPANVSELAPDLFQDIDKLIVLDHIVERLPLAMPIDSARQTSGFGRRVDPFTSRWAMHTGQDWVGPYGTRIKATAAGRVISAGYHGAYGNKVDVDHGYGVTTRYAHLSSINVKPGQFVTKGQLVGRQGNTGRSTGSHLHYEVRLYDRPLNPTKFIAAGTHVQKFEKKAAH